MRKLYIQWCDVCDDDNCCCVHLGLAEIGENGEIDPSAPIVHEALVPLHGIDEIANHWQQLRLEIEAKGFDAATPTHRGGSA